MSGYIDFFSKYVMGSVQMLLGFSFFARFLNKRAKLSFYLLFAAGGAAAIHFAPSGRIAEFVAFTLMLVASGIVLLHSDWKSALFYAALVVEAMQLCYGIVGSLSGILFLEALPFSPKIAGIGVMVLGEMASLLLFGLCCHVVRQYFSYYGAMEKQYIFLVLIPLLLLFFMGESINSALYGLHMAEGMGEPFHGMPFSMLVMQLLGLASLFCILFAYKKLLQSFRLSAELSLLEQEERYMAQYVEEAKAHYEKTRAFRHDIKNHLTVVKELLLRGELEQALSYMGDMDELAGELSFPCSTNNPVVDILVGKKLGMAKSMGISVGCSLFLPYPCGLRDMDICIILSNALDNAIHACKAMGGGREKYIHVAGRMQGDLLFIEVKNSFQGNGPCQPGTGLSNVKAVAERYHGAMDIKTEGASFSLSALLIIPQHPESILQQMDSFAPSASRKGN